MSKHLKLCFFLLFLLSAISAHAEIAITLSPAIPVQGQALTFTVEDAQVTSAVLFYRATGSTQYQQKYTAARDQHIEITLDETEVVAPGIQYYIKVTRNGTVELSPPLYPEYSPHTVSVEKNSAPNFRLISPDTTQPAQGEQLNIIIDGQGRQIALEHLLVTLDNTDITPLVKIKDGNIEFETNLMPSPGKHTISIATNDNQRQQQWAFQVQNPRKAGTRQFYGKGNVSFNYGMNIKENSGSSFSDTLSANASMSFGAKGDDWEATWDGVNLRYVKDAKPHEVTMGAGFHFTLTKGQQFFEYGDISVNETQLTVASLSRRGVQAKLLLGQNNVDMFYVGSNTVKDWDSGLSDSENFVRGFAWQRDWLNGTLPVTVVFSDGKNSGNGYNTSRNTPGSEGEVFGIALNPTLYDVNINMEVAFSHYNKDTSSGLGYQNDLSALLGFSTTVGMFALTGDYHYYGTDFGSVATPNATTDRSGVSLSGSTRLGASSITLNGSYEWDNIEDDPTRPVVSSVTGGISWGLALPDWPAISVSYNHSQQDSTKEPVGTDPVDNYNDTVNATISTSGNWWSASLGGNYGKLTDNVGQLGSKTKGFNLSGSLTPMEGFSVSPAINYVTTNKSGGVSTDSEVASLTATFPVWKEYLTSNLQGSVNHQETSDNSTDTITYNGSFRLAFNFDQLSKKLFDYDGKQTLALRVNYNRVDDRISSGNDTEEWSVFLDFNLLSFSRPIDWSVDF